MLGQVDLTVLLDSEVQEPETNKLCVSVPACAEFDV